MNSKVKYAYESDAPSLCEIFKDYFDVGAAISTGYFKPGREKDLEAAKKQFNIFVLENECKPAFTEPNEGEFVFDNVDKFVDFGQSVGAKLRGHTLVWHQSCPEWFFYDKDHNEVSSELLLEKLHSHVTTLVSRYKGRIRTWDVVNEVISQDGTGYRDSMWYKISKTEYVKEAFRAAHAADPNARLIINDYDLERNPAKADTMVRFVTEMANEGIPVHGVGLQSHLYLKSTDMDVMKRNIERLMVLRDIIPDFKFEVTELDMNCYLWEDRTNFDIDWTDELHQLFIRQYTEVFRQYIDLSKAGVLDTVLFWGVHDGGSWLNSFPNKHKNYPLFLDRELALKPVFYEIAKLAGK